jgi:hypothetical protein
MLPFDAGSLFGAFAYYHMAFWPLPWLALASSAATLLLAARGFARAALLLLAAGWIWVGAAWHIATFAGLNFAAPIYGALFILQGVLLAWAATSGQTSLRFRRRPRDWAGLGLAVTALAGYPLLDLLSGVAWPAVRLPGSDPCPTALFTLGVLLLAEGRSAAGLMMLPALWTLAAGATGWVIGIGHDQILPLGAVTALVLALWPGRVTAR